MIWQVGDYILSPLLCVERKSIPDLIQSFGSGEQLAQPMLKLKCEHEGLRFYLFTCRPSVQANGANVPFLLSTYSPYRIRPKSAIPAASAARTQRWGVISCPHEYINFFLLNFVFFRYHRAASCQSWCYYCCISLAHACCGAGTAMLPYRSSKCWSTNRVSPMPFRYS